MDGRRIVSGVLFSMSSELTDIELTGTGMYTAGEVNLSELPPYREVAILSDSAYREVATLSETE